MHVVWCGRLFHWCYHHSFVRFTLLSASIPASLPLSLSLLCLCDRVVPGEFRFYLQFVGSSSAIDLAEFNRQLLVFLASTYGVPASRFRLASILPIEVSVSAVRARLLSWFSPQATDTGFQVAVDVLPAATGESVAVLAARITANPPSFAFTGTQPVARSFRVQCADGSTAQTTESCPTASDSGLSDVGVAVVIAVAFFVVAVALIIGVYCYKRRQQQKATAHVPVDEHPDIPTDHHAVHVDVEAHPHAAAPAAVAAPAPAPAPAAAASAPAAAPAAATNDAVPTPVPVPAVPLQSAPAIELSPIPAADAPNQI
jgi:hypothetical protein